MKTCYTFFVAFLFLIFTHTGYAQNTKIKCYFNHAVNTALSTGTGATYLNGTFPDTIAAYINRAKSTIDVAVYNFTSNGSDIVSKIATAINSAYTRGVVVRWIHDGSSSNSGVNLLNANIPRLASPTTSSYGIMHNKFLAIDVNTVNANDAFVITGSYNFSTAQTNTDYNNLLIIQDKNVAVAYYNEFNKMWGGTAATPNLTTSTFGTNKTSSALHYFNVNGTQIQIHFSPKDSCGKYLKNVINSASSDLFFGIYTFTDNSIATPILNKFNSGSVAVRGIMDNFSKTYTPFTTLSSTLGSNMIVYNGAGLYHNKIFIADALNFSSDPQVATGSFNWSLAAQNSNDENFLVIHDSSIVNQYYQSLCKNIADLGGTPCIVPLPIDWVSFQAKINVNNHVFLNWITNRETNNDHFEIEKSPDGKEFQRIGIVNATHNNRLNDYQFVDEKMNDGSNYYRIKQVDEDGNFAYSKIVSIYNRTETTVNIFPNPASNKLHITLPTNSQVLNIYSVTGVKLQSIVVAGLERIDLPINNLVNSNYIVEILTKNNKFVKTFTKF